MSLKGLPSFKNICILCTIFIYEWKSEVLCLFSYLKNSFSWNCIKCPWHTVHLMIFFSMFESLQPVYVWSCSIWGPKLIDKEITNVQRNMTISHQLSMLYIGSQSVWVWILRFCCLQLSFWIHCWASDHISPCTPEPGFRCSDSTSLDVLKSRLMTLKGDDWKGFFVTKGHWSVRSYKMTLK